MVELVLYVLVVYLLRASLNGAVLAGHVLAVPVVCGAAGQAQVGVTLPHCQVAGTLLGVALSFAAAAGETVLTCESKVCFISKEFLQENQAVLFTSMRSYTQSCTGRTSRRSFEP